MLNQSGVLPRAETALFGTYENGRKTMDTMMPMELIPNANPANISVPKNTCHVVFVGFRKFFMTESKPYHPIT